MTLAGNHLYAHPSTPFLPSENQEPTAHKKSPSTDPESPPADSKSLPADRKSLPADPASLPLVDEVYLPHYSATYYLYM